ncbi:MAG TPA: ATP-binding protein [Candidatus Binatia bacterium]|nr:ATP-binding protein [Candidatus Binatia bacterium]
MAATDRSDLLGVLSAVLAAVRASTVYPDVLARICEALTRSVPCDRATVYAWSRRRKLYLPAADHGTPAEVVGDFIRRGWAPGTFPGEAELRAGRCVIATRDQADGLLAETLELARLHALVVLPLGGDDGAEGSLACGWHEPPGFTPRQVAVLEEVAPNIAVLIQNARLQSEARRLAARRADLATWTATLIAPADPTEMAARLRDASCHLFRATHAGLLLVDGDTLVARRTMGPSTGETVRVPLAGDSLVGESLRTGRVLLVNQFQKSPYADAAFAMGRRPKAALMAPLIDPEGPIGVLAVVDYENSYRFGPNDEEDARLLAAIATVALRKGGLVHALTRASAAKSDFLANVSHDLRTPLNVIIGYAQLLAEGTFGPIADEQRDALERILRTATGQVGLINDLLDLARIEQGKLACELRPVAVASLVPSLRETMEILLRDRPVRFEVAVAPDAVASTDAERLRQVLVNLLANAAKFTQAGAVRLLAAREGEAVRVSVQDTGPGMDPALGARALEPFVRGADGPTGSGLGLAIVSRLLPLLGGRLAIESAPGRGTDVQVRLPAA